MYLEKKKTLPSLKLTSPLKMMVSNRNLLFQGVYLDSRAMLVSGRVNLKGLLPGIIRDNPPIA